MVAAAFISRIDLAYVNVRRDGGAGVKEADATSSITVSADVSHIHYTTVCIACQRTRSHDQTPLLSHHIFSVRQTDFSSTFGRLYTLLATSTPQDAPNSGLTCSRIILRMTNRAASSLASFRRRQNFCRRLAPASLSAAIFSLVRSTLAAISSRNRKLAQHLLRRIGDSVTNMDHILHLKGDRCTHPCSLNSES